MLTKWITLIDFKMMSVIQYQCVLVTIFLSFHFSDELVEPKLCEVFNPPFGCCWDNKTVALGPHSEGCPGNETLLF